MDGAEGAGDRFLPLAEPWYPPSYADAVRDQLLSGFIGPGEASAGFAKTLGEICGVPHVVLTVSGTVALTVAAQAIGLRPGDEILVPAYGVISTINAFGSMGLAPRLVDIDRATACMDPASLEAAITPRTKAVCFVNFAGHTGAPLLAAVEICRRHGLPLIEDAACALGHGHDGRPAGSFGTVGTLSFSVPKVLSTGQGGAVLTSDKAVADRAAAWIDHGDLDWRRTNLNREIGSNLRFNDIQGRFGLCQALDLADRLARRRASFGAMAGILGDALYDVPGPEAPLHNVIFVDDPAAAASALRARKIGATVQYRTVSQHPSYAALADRPFPNADWWTDHALYLPFGMALSVEDATRIGRAVTQLGNQLRRP